MSTDTNEQAPPSEAAAGSPSAASRAEGQVDPGSAPPADAAPTGPAAAPAAPAPKGAPAPDARVEAEPPRNLLLYTILGFFCIGIAVWIVFAGIGYKEKYAQQTEGWQVGRSRMIEITLVREDKKNLACRSDREVGGVHCGQRTNGQVWGQDPDVDPNTLQPFNTVKNELFLAAGLWQQPALAEPLPAERFTVVCRYQILGLLRSVSLRWSATGTFGPADQSVAVGTLSDCVIPQ